MAGSAASLRPSPAIQPLLRPILRAYVLAYLTTASPRILSLVIGVLRRKLGLQFALAKIKAVTRQNAGYDRFPAVCGFLVGGAVVIPKIVHELLSTLLPNRKLAARRASAEDYWIRFSAAFVSAWGAFYLLNKRPSLPIESDSEHLEVYEVAASARPKNRRRRSSVRLSTDSGLSIEQIPTLAGRTLDLTLFACVRALGIVVNSAWSRLRKQEKQPSKLTALLEDLGPSSLFAFSSFFIMYNWFYSPERLPSNYRNWISSAAQIDRRLIEALRQCRYGNFVYYKDTGLGPLLRGMCRDLGYPEVWGDPAITVPVPCELYHSGTGRSCEWHAIVRFARGWAFAMNMYLPLNLLWLSRREKSKRSLSRALLEASQSSAFLGAFVASFYYAVCLARTRVGPKLFSRKTVTATMWDAGLCVEAGCLACGWSILLEKPIRRQEIAFFVAPRALATICPRRYDRSYISREQFTFAVSAAIVVVAAQRSPQQINGVFGRFVSLVFG